MVETQDSTKKRFCIKPYSYNTITYNDFIFHGNVIKININNVTRSRIFRLKDIKKDF